MLETQQDTRQSTKKRFLVGFLLFLGIAVNYMGRHQLCHAGSGPCNRFHAYITGRKRGRPESGVLPVQLGRQSSRQAMIDGINALAAMADWVLPGINEGRLLTGRDSPREIAGFYLERRAKLVVIKLGAAGAYFRTHDDEGEVAGVKVEKVVDTVGAGDGFAAGLVSGLREGLDIRSAMARGNQVGAFAIQVIGDMDGLPTREQLAAVMA